MSFIIHPNLVDTPAKVLALIPIVPSASPLKEGILYGITGINNGRNRKTVVLGWHAGTNSNDLYEQTAIGYGAFGDDPNYSGSDHNYTGSGVALGYHAGGLLSNSYTDNIIAIGYEALWQVSGVSDDNISIGTQSGAGSSFSNQNTAIGHRAAQGSTLNNTISLGSKANEGASATNTISIGNYANSWEINNYSTVNATDSVVIGHNSLSLNSNNIIIGHNITSQDPNVITIGNNQHAVLSIPGLAVNWKQNNLSVPSGFVLGELTAGTPVQFKVGNPTTSGEYINFMGEGGMQIVAPSGLTLSSFNTTNLSASAINSTSSTISSMTGDTLSVGGVNTLQVNINNMLLIETVHDVINNTSPYVLESLYAGQTEELTIALTQATGKRVSKILVSINIDGSVCDYTEYSIIEQGTTIPVSYSSSSTSGGGQDFSISISNANVNSTSIKVKREILY